jgi:hypothetical protein
MFLVPALAATTVLVIRQLMESGGEEFVMPILFGGFFGIRSLVESVWTNGQSWEAGASVAFVVAILSAGLGYAARMITEPARD